MICPDCRVEREFAGRLADDDSIVQCEECSLAIPRDALEAEQPRLKEVNTFLEIQDILENAGRADLAEVFHQVWVEYYHRNDDLIEVECILKEFRRRNPRPEGGA